MEIRQRSQKRINAASHQILFRACADGVTRLDPVSEDNFSFDVCCQQCNTLYPNQKLSKETKENKEINEFVNFYLKCEKCQHNLRIEVLRNYLHSTAGISNNWEPLYNVDCRECFIDIVHCDAWTITSTSGKKYEWDGQKDFFDYDDEAAHPVGITDIDFYVRPLD
ncbi:hypothetical protein TVAG_414020 [Trichomonas vaginalis G3]|uniref:Uncharacterized protein n=1 Tax=Trichomonas vaginalis (strain ATCC PRA-98 / G3) TaxID=412133 RepID=A2EC74_TRIV3|nr:MAL13P1.257-like family [Trichomonas vaginalis G3]EAY09751.1 hypothetical protein TVAG_414020 [Trichomonas vaginalis G3]KAI5550909.1 MAL13P1.257-like family [Trichomonas vaginalis G3]|eukprot:XP_001321974.1 hypothetical protein [Trichomonas vaginalis G3]